MGRRRREEIEPAHLAKIRAVFLKLQELRYRRNMTQTAVGRLSGLSAPGVSYLENGRVPHTSLLTIIRVAEALGYDTNVIFTVKEVQDELPPVR